METAIWNLKVELAIAIFFLGMEVFSLIHGKVKARIQSKKILPQEEMKDAMGWLFSH